MFYANIRDWYQYSAKKNDYIKRIQMLNSQLTELDEMLKMLCDEANSLMKTYNVEMKIKCEKHTKGGTMGVWVLNSILMDCVSIKHRYPKRVRDFSRINDEQRETLNAMLSGKDSAFTKQLLKYEKQRISLNNSVNVINKIITQLEQLAKEPLALKKIIE